MEGSWRKHLRLGVIQGMMFPDAPDNAARTLETAKQIFMDDFFGVLVVGRMDDDTTKAVKGMARGAHADIAIGAAPVLLGGKLNLANVEEERRRAAVEALKKSVDDAYLLDAPLVEVLDGGKSYPGPEREQQATDQLVRSLKELCAYSVAKAAGRQPVCIALETFDRAVDKCSLVGPSDLAVKVAAQVLAEYANFGLTIDMSHLPLIGESYRDSLQTTKDYLVHIHLGNCITDRSNPFYGDSHPGFGMEGGVADVAELTEFLAALHETGYFEKKLPTGMPWLTFEIKPQPSQAPELLIANCKRAFEEAWARL